MRRGAGLFVAALALAGCEARAQQVPSPARGPAPRLTVTLRRNTDGTLDPPVVRGTGLLGDGVFETALLSSFPVRYQFRLELWRAAQAFFDRLEREAEWGAIVRLDPLTNEYDLIRTDGSVEHFTTVDALTTALGTPFAVDILPEQSRDPRERYYCVATLVIESLALSELEELERWLKGDFGPAISRRGDVGDALGRGVRRLLIRFSGLPRRKLETRSETFRLGLER